jgi:hypothetical protein
MLILKIFVQASWTKNLSLYLHVPSQAPKKSWEFSRICGRHENMFYKTPITFKSHEKECVNTDEEVTYTEIK